MRDSIKPLHNIYISVKKDYLVTQHAYHILQTANTGSDTALGPTKLFAKGKQCQDVVVKSNHAQCAQCNRGSYCTVL